MIADKMKIEMRIAALLRSISGAPRVEFCLENCQCSVIAKLNVEQCDLNTMSDSELGTAIANSFNSIENADSFSVAGVGCWKLLPGRQHGGETFSSVAADRIAVVTGGAQGFGEGLVNGLVEAGSFVYIADMNIAGAKELAEQINKEKKEIVAFAVEVNVTDEDSVQSMVELITLQSGGIDLFISNAGVLKAGSVKELTLRDFKFVTDVNYVGYFICTKFVSPVMALMNLMDENRYADIIQINSKSGLEGSNKNGAYSGGKFGGIGLTQSFALELISDRIKVNSVCPGNFFEGPLWSDPDRGLFVQYLNTGKVPGAKSLEDVKSFYEQKVPMKRGCRPEDVMKAILYIVDQEYETGQAVPVTGGQVMLK